MLNPIPELLNFGLLAPFIIRVTAGLFLMKMASAAFAYGHQVIHEKRPDLSYRSSRAAGFIIGLLGAIASIMLIVGYFTQIGAITAIVIFAASAILKRKHPETLHKAPSFYLVLAVISFTLLLSGAGAFAFDLPL